MRGGRTSTAQRGGQARSLSAEERNDNELRAWGWTVVAFHVNNGGVCSLKMVLLV